MCLLDVVSFRVESEALLEARPGKRRGPGPALDSGGVSSLHDHLSQILVPRSYIQPRNKTCHDMQTFHLHIPPSFPPRFLSK